MPRREHKGGAASTTLASLMAVGATSFTVASGGGSGYPTGGVGPFFICIDAGTALEEKILCSSRSGDVFTVAGSGRGQDDTIAVEHASGAVVQHVFAALEADEANAHINAGTGVHNRTSQLASISDAETLTNKSISGASNTLSAIPQSAVNNLTTDLAAKVDDAQIHSSWLTPLGAALDADAATVLGAMGTGWPAILGVAPGTNWTAAIAATLDADAASLLANIANGWVAILQAAPGSGWAAALAAAYPPDVDVQLFTADGTWTKPAGAKKVRVRLVGGGGAGGAAVTGGSGEGNGAGGGGGGYVEHLYDASALGATEAVDVGAGGAGGSGSGGAGSASTFDTMSAGGGAGGESMTRAASAASTPGQGGSASGGNIANIPGGDGTWGIVRGSAVTCLGTGGASHMGGATSASTGAEHAGATGSAYGGGGEGGYNFSATTFNGGSGAAGAVIVETYF